MLLLHQHGFPKLKVIILSKIARLFLGVIINTSNTGKLTVYCYLYEIINVGIGVSMECTFRALQALNAIVVHSDLFALESSKIGHKKSELTSSLF